MKILIVLRFVILLKTTKKRVMALTFECKCGSPYVLKNYNKHTKTCPKFIVECQLCKKQMIREKMLDSSFHTTECYFIKDHLRSEEIKFLKNENELLNAQCRQMSERLQEMATLNKILSAKFQQLERKLSDRTDDSDDLRACFAAKTIEFLEKIQNLDRKLSDQNYFSQFECTQTKIDNLGACLAAQNNGLSKRIQMLEQKLSDQKYSSNFQDTLTVDTEFIFRYCLTQNIDFSEKIENLERKKKNVSNSGSTKRKIDDLEARLEAQNRNFSNEIQKLERKLFVRAPFSKPSNTENISTIFMITEKVQFILKNFIQHVSANISYLALFVSVFFFFSGFASFLGTFRDIFHCCIVILLFNFA